MLVIRDLAEGRSRFCELERSLEGISPRTLSLRLRALEEEGVVQRQTFPEVPPRVEYALTEKGRALVPIVESMRTYGREWLNADGECADAARGARAGRRRRLTGSPEAVPSAKGVRRGASGPRSMKLAGSVRKGSAPRGIRPAF